MVAINSALQQSIHNQRQRISRATIRSSTAQMAWSSRHTLAIMLIVGLLAVVTNATDQKSVHSSPASPSSTISSNVVSHKDEIYIDDEGIEGSGGHGGIHDDLEKDPDYSGSGFGPDDEDSSTEHHQHRRPSIHTQTGISKQNSNLDNDFIGGRTHQTNTAGTHQTGAGTGSVSGNTGSDTGNTGILSGSGNSGLNTIDDDDIDLDETQGAFGSGDGDDFDHVGGAGSRAGIGAVNGHHGRGRIDDDDDHTGDDDDRELFGGSHPSIPFYTGNRHKNVNAGHDDHNKDNDNDNDDDDDDDITNIDENRPDHDRDHHNAGAGSSDTGTGLGNKLHDNYDDIVDEDEDDADSDDNYDDNDEEDNDDDDDSIGTVHGDDDGSDGDDGGTELYTDGTVSNNGNGNGGADSTTTTTTTIHKRPDLNNQGTIHELDSNNINSLSPDTKVVEHTTGNEVFIMSDDDRTTSFFAQPGILAAVIGGAVVGLLCAILVVMFIVYRMRKKDEGSYALDEPKRSPAVNSYAKNANNREFYA